jgi:hypothetical protein
MGITTSRKNRQRNERYVEAGLGEDRKNRSRRNLHSKRKKVPVTNDILARRDQQKNFLTAFPKSQGKVEDEKFDYECPWSIAGTQVREGRMRYAHTADIKPESSKAVT